MEQPLFLQYTASIVLLSGAVLGLSWLKQKLLQLSQQL